jgi:hypothetical protein
MAGSLALSATHPILRLACASDLDEKMPVGPPELHLYKSGWGSLAIETFLLGDIETNFNSNLTKFSIDEILCRVRWSCPLT